VQLTNSVIELEQQFAPPPAPEEFPMKVQPVSRGLESSSARKPPARK